MIATDSRFGYCAPVKRRRFRIEENPAATFDDARPLALFDDHDRIVELGARASELIELAVGHGAEEVEHRGQVRDLEGM